MLVVIIVDLVSYLLDINWNSKDASSFFIGRKPISSIISNIIFIGTEGINTKALIYGIILTLFGVISVASITTFISMSIKSEAGGLAPVLIIYLTLMFYIVGMEFFDENIMNVLNNILPFGQVMTLNVFEVPKDVLFKTICMIGQVLVTSSLGYAIFRKTDLK